MKCVDLFCGCGGLSLGFNQAGIRIVCAYDYWRESIECYRQNLKHSAIIADLSNVRKMSKEISAMSPDIIIGGPPCQDFSHAGKRQERGQADLTVCFAQIIKSVRPRWFVMENVDRVKRSNAYCKAREIFVKSGYGLTEEVLNASAFGVPQNRRRFFCIGLLDASDGFLTDDIRLMENSRAITVREYFDSVGHKADVQHYYRHPRNYSRRGVFSLDEPAPTIRGVNRPVPSGYGGHAGDTHCAEKVRPLSSMERALIQTFPDNFKLIGNKTTIEQMIGNAVPVNLAKAVASAVVLYDKMPMATKKRGRKAVRESIGGVKRDVYMRWVVSSGMSEKSAKDAWSWLSQAWKYGAFSDDFAYETDMPQFARKAGSDFDGATVSHMKKAIRIYCEIKSRLSHVKKANLFLPVVD